MGAPKLALFSDNRTSCTKQDCQSDAGMTEQWCVRWALSSGHDHVHLACRTFPFLPVLSTKVFFSPFDHLSSVSMILIC